MRLLGWWGVRSCSQWSSQSAVPPSWVSGNLWAFQLSQCSGALPTLVGVWSCEGSGTLPFLPANKFACHSFTGVKRHKMLLHVCLFLWREHYFYLFRLSAIQICFKNWCGTKSYWCLAHKTWRNTRDPWRIVQQWAGVMKAKYPTTHDEELPKMLIVLSLHNTKGLVG